MDNFSQRESEYELLGLGRIHLARDNPIVPCYSIVNPIILIKCVFYIKYIMYELSLSNECQ